MNQKLQYLLCAGAVCAMLFGCGKKQAVTLPDLTEIVTLPTPTETQAPTNPNAGVEELTAVLSAGEIYTLEQYPDLKKVDLSGSTCYDTILEYMDAHPDVEVIYTVDLGGTTVSNQAASVRLEAGKYTYEALLENLKYLPNLTSVSISAVNLTAEQVETLRSTYP
ncbi:MAG TPA: hypothetical protein DCO69_06650, partial [Clostridiales bacterium]|nr:hypothetical protein [Clostridiales bacterium]